MYYFRTTFLTIKIGIEQERHRCFQQEFVSFSIILMILFKLKRKRNYATYIFKTYYVFCLTFMTFAKFILVRTIYFFGLAAVLSATGPMMILLIQAKRNREKLQKNNSLLCYCTNRCYICFFTRNASTSKFHVLLVLF